MKLENALLLFPILAAVLAISVPIGADQATSGGLLKTVKGPNPVEIYTEKNINGSTWFVNNLPSSKDSVIVKVVSPCCGEGQVTTIPPDKQGGPFKLNKGDKLIVEDKNPTNEHGAKVCAKRFL